MDQAEEQRQEKIADAGQELVRKIGGTLMRTAEGKPALFNKETRTAELVWTTGATVKRSGWFDEWNETLSLDTGAVRMDRFNGGSVPVLKNHDSRDIANVIGVVERAWIDQGEGRATVRFSDRPDVEGILRDIENGILRNISVGYKIHQLKETTLESDEIRSFVATDWEPLELSVVPIPADAAAGFRAEGRSDNQCEPVEERMTEQKKPEVDIEAVRKEAIEAERKRSAEIMGAVKAAKLDESFAQELIERGISADEARKQVIDKLAAAPAPKTESHVRIEVGTEARDNRLAGAQSALLHRYDSKKHKLEERGVDFVGKSLVEVAREFCEANGIRTRGMSASAISERALHSTSDFPLLLSNVANKTLRDAYAEAPMTWMPLVREVELADFKEVTRLQLGDAPSLEAVPESGEFKRGTIGEAKEAYKLGTYGKVVAITRQVIVNDDLGAFTRVPALMARAAADLQSDIVWAIIGQNQTMADGSGLFHADHSNLAAVAAVIGVDSVGKGRESMRKQVGLGGRLINVQPQYLVVPTSLETKAQQFTAAIQPVQTSEVNPFSGSLQVIAEPRLDSYSLTAWYLAASPAQIDTIEVAYLAGERGPQVSSREGFDVDGVELKIRLDFAARALEYRGMFKNAGV